MVRLSLKKKRLPQISSVSMLKGTNCKFYKEATGILRRYPSFLWKTEVTKSENSFKSAGFIAAIIVIRSSTDKCGTIICTSRTPSFGEIPSRNNGDVDEIRYSIILT